MATETVRQSPAENQLTPDEQRQLSGLVEYVHQRSQADAAQIAREIAVAEAMLRQGDSLISQEELALFVSLRQRLEQLEKQVAFHTQRFTERLQAGAVIEPGLLSAEVKSFERRNVAWKQVCLRKLGEAFCRRVLAATRPETYTRLVVEAK